MLFYASVTIDEETTYTSWTIKKETDSYSEYVQYRLMSKQWSTTVSDWQGVDDVVTLVNDNLPNNKAVLNLMDELMVDVPFITHNYALLANGKFGTSTSYKHASFKVNAGERYVIKNTQNSSDATPYTRYAFTTNNVAESGGVVPVVVGTSVVVVPIGGTTLVAAPVGC